MRGDRLRYDKHFDYISGSNQWPSADPEDSSYDIFVCRHCGYEIQHQMYGTWSLNEPSLDERLQRKLIYHIVECPEVRP